MPDITIPAESVEFMQVPVTDEDGAPITNFQTAVTRWPARPTAWTNAVTQGGEYGVSLAGLTHGTWQVWVKVSGTVIAAGSVWVE